MIGIIISILVGYITNRKGYNTIQNYLEIYSHNFRIIGHENFFTVIGDFHPGIGYFMCTYNEFLNCYNITTNLERFITKIFIEGNDFKDEEERFLGCINGNTIILKDKSLNKEYVFELSLK